MAAGEGRRLRPLTEHWPKPLLPVDGRPVLGTLLRELASAGLTDVTVVSGHLGEQVDAFVGDGTAFGVRARLARQPRAEGSADAVRRALAAGAKPPLLVLAADTVFPPGDLARASEAWLASGTAGGLGLRAIADAGPERPAVDVRDGLVTALHTRGPEGRGPRLVPSPAWWLDEELAASLEALPGPPYELVKALERALAAGRGVLALEHGPTRDLTSPQDVVMCNHQYLVKKA
jgi:MurNAc alpha-1-phosphate uridylyltransferase